MSTDEILIKFTLDELLTIEYLLTQIKDRKVEKTEKDLEVDDFIEHMLVKIAKVKLDQNIINEVAKNFGN